MSNTEPDNVVALHAGLAVTSLGETARSLVEKHWPAIEQGTDNNSLQTEATVIAAQMSLSPDASEHFQQLIVGEIKARDQAKIRASACDLVEDFWRTLLSIGKSSSSAAEAQDKIAELEQVFHKGIDRVAESLSLNDATVFRVTIEEEDNALALLRQTDRSAFLKRLKLPDDQISQTKTGQHNQGIGEMMVKTAVRATIWEGIRALFRAF